MSSALEQSFTDPDAYAGFIPSTQVQLTIAKTGQFKARTSLIELHDIRMQRFSDNLPRVAHTAAKPGRMIISFRTAPGPNLVWGGLEMSPETILRHTEAFDAFQKSSGCAAWGSMSVSLAAVADIGSMMAGHELAPPGDSIIIKPSSAAMWRLQKIHAEIDQLATSAPDRFACAAAVKGMEQALFEAMVSCLGATESQQTRGAQARHAAVMRKFHAFLEVNPDAPVYMSEVSAALGISARTLRACCQEHLGMGAKRYLMLRRLHFARRALQKADPNVLRVTDVATEFGFWELGRFAGVYKSVFGKSPSKTLEAA